MQRAVSENRVHIGQACSGAFVGSAGPDTLTSVQIRDEKSLPVKLAKNSLKILLNDFKLIHSAKFG